VGGETARVTLDVTVRCIVYCPNCGAEYREGLTECSDCLVSLTWEKPPEPKADGHPDLELVTVLEGNNPLLIGSAQGLLEEAGIPFYVSGDEIGPRYGPVGAFLHPWCRVQVALDREQEARTLLRSLEEDADFSGGCT
jgi:hypothetical protein